MTAPAVVAKATLYRWLATFMSVGAVVWGGLAYYINAQDIKYASEQAAKIALMQAQLDVLKVRQDNNAKFNDLVIVIDRRLAGIESSINHQTKLFASVSGKVDGLQDKIATLEVRMAVQGRQ